MAVTRWSFVASSVTGVTFLQATNQTRLSMNKKSRAPHTLSLALAISSALAAFSASAVTTLEGWALMPATTYAVGPTTGQFGGNGFGANSNLLPIPNGQSVQGFSAVLPGPVGGTYRVMPDNGFGAQGNSADALLRVYGVNPDFKTATGGTSTVSAVDYNTGAAQPSFNASSFIGLHDPDHKIGFAIQADFGNYYNNAANPAVDASIISNRLLTGADFDIESMRQDKNGNLWFGEEFGPFLLKADASGKILRSEVGLPDVKAPQNPYLAGGTPNLGGSRGFEGMAINTAGDKLFTLLEGSVIGDPAKSLRINEFDIDTEQYTGQQWLYKLEGAGTNIGDMEAVSDHEFLVIERNGATATGGGTPFKKIYLADTNVVDANGFVKKTEIVDLMNIADPDDLNSDGSNVFTFPYVTIEDVLLLDASTLLVINDNNFPGGGGRSLAPDQTEFLKLHLAQPVPVPAAVWLLGSALAGLRMSRRKAPGAA
jgi:hypothetical protein